MEYIIVSIELELVGVHEPSLYKIEIFRRFNIDNLIIQTDEYNFHRPLNLQIDPSIAFVQNMHHQLAHPSFLPLNKFYDEI